MRRTMLCTLCLLLLFVRAQAAGLSGLLTKRAELPDPKPLLAGGATLYDILWTLEDGTQAVAYTYAMPEDTEAFLSAYEALLSNTGYTLSKTTVEQMDAFEIAADSQSAYLVPDYKGALLLLVPKGIPFSPLPTREPTPIPTPTPKPVNTSVPYSGGSSGGHWETVHVQLDCPGCIGGVCDLCKGTGVYRLYGTAINCSRSCETCDGAGWYLSTQRVWVFD